MQTFRKYSEIIEPIISFKARLKTVIFDVILLRLTFISTKNNENKRQKYVLSETMHPKIIITQELNSNSA